jgi:predicted Zn finger-like uncharacterized protein
VSDFQDVICPSCREQHLVDLDELPVEGGFRVCPHCGTSIKVTRDASLGVAMVTAAPLPEEPGDSGEESLAIFIKMPTGNVERLSAGALEQGIQMRKVLPWDLVSNDGRDFEAASERPDLRRLFLPGDFVPQAQTRCANHPDLMPAATCRRCGRSYCSQCAGALLRIQPRLCPACNGPCAEPDARLRETPPWKRPKEVVRFPIDGSAWIVTLVLGALVWITGFSLYLFPLNLTALPVLLDAVLRSSKGARTWTILSRFSDTDWGALLRETIPIALVSAVLAVPFLLIPLALGPGLGVLVQFPMMLFLFFYYPMAVALLLVGSDKDRALKPGTVVRAIWSLRDEYFVYLALFIAVAVGVVAVLTVLSFIPLLDRILQSAALAYGWVLQAHFLGFFIYMNRERLRAAA